MEEKIFNREDYVLVKREDICTGCAFFIEIGDEGESCLVLNNDDFRCEGLSNIFVKKQPESNSPQNDSKIEA